MAKSLSDRSKPHLTHDISTMGGILQYIHGTEGGTEAIQGYVKAIEEDNLPVPDERPQTLRSLSVSIVIRLDLPFMLRDS
jgi:hypothetical protein